MRSVARTVSVAFVLCASFARPAASQELVCPADAHPDLYCMRLIPSPRVLGGPVEPAGIAELRRPVGPFSLALTEDGRVRHDVHVTTAGLPDPATLGDFDTYVAWAATPSLTSVQRLGVVPAEGVAELGEVALNAFMLLISAEPDPPGAEPTGPFVLRARSPSMEMQPADFLEFTLGAAPVTDQGAMVADPWSGVPMPPGIMMLPAMMSLRPAASAWVPGTDREGNPWSGDIVDARPRELIRLADGDSVALEAVYVRRSIGDRELLGYGFNGQIPGPLLWVTEDATITVQFTNRIDWPTAIHWHGIRLENRFDGVPGVTQDPIETGDTFTYEIHFPDPGLYWYHPHHREDVQQDLGLAGNLMVRSPDPDYYGPVHREEVVMLDDLLLGEHGIVPYGLERATHALMGRFGNTMLVNGAPTYELDVDRGEVVRFFFTNVSNTRTFNLSFDGAPMKLVGTDVGNFEREEPVRNLIIAPAERYIAHVMFPESGTVRFLNRVQGIDHIAARFIAETDTLGVVRVGDRTANPAPSRAFLENRVHERVRTDIAPYRPLFERAPDLELVLDMTAEGLPLRVERLMRIDSLYFHPLEASGTMPMMNLMATPDEVAWTLTDSASGLRNRDIDWAFSVGDVVKLRLRSERQTLHQMQHPIHIHGQRFLVLAVNGVANENLAWKDTVLVPVGATVDVLLELSNPGRWMLHCHIAEHLEAGMSMVFTVSP
jgi:FtsP/CotA-like multicopper oxidase with cupredoxin domain